MTDKQSLIFIYSFVTITFSILGWLCASFLSSNKYVWIISMPIIFFIAIVEVYIMTEAIYGNRDDR